MRITVKIILFAAVGIISLFYRQDEISTNEEIFTAFTIEAKSADIEFYWKNDDGANFGSIQNLENYAEAHGKHLRFAMNGGMYQEDGKPLGVFVQNGRIVTPLNLRNADGNFYIQPNGVFYLTNQHRAFVVPTADFQLNQNIRFATQSGPMLIVDGRINSIFQPASPNLNIRNGVCVLDNGKIIFAISRRKINFYDFANYFKNSGCQNALYLDGFVSRMYAPEKNISQTDGNFGVIIGIVE
ncbi:MAG: phosphodiester glycosidase family protein [Pyrinomonadaceae bacterium]